MAQSYALAVGKDNAAGLQNIENLFKSVYGERIWGIRSEMVTAGSEERVTLDQQVTYTGVIVVRWNFSVLPFTHLATLVNTFIGSFTTHSAAVTITTRDADNTFSNFNAVMVLPRAGQDYTRAKANYIRDLNITFRDLVAI